MNHAGSNTFIDHFNENDSPILDINESFVKSDIAEIISKMYTPVAKVSESTQGSGPQTRVTHESKNYDQETTNWRRDGSPRNHFGFYIETVHSESEVRTVIDSSTSDEVSMPIIEHIPRPHGYICRCCRRKMERGISKPTKTECTNCKQKLIVKHPIKKTSQPNTFDSCWNQRRGDGYCGTFEGRLENKYLGYRKSAPAVIYNRQSQSRQEKRQNSNRRICRSSENRLNDGRRLQVVPDLSVDDSICAKEVVKCSSSTKVAKKTTIFKRVVNSVSAWPVIFYKKTKHSTQLFKGNNIDFQNVNQNEDFRYLLSCQEQTSQVIQCSPRRVPETIDKNLLKHCRDVKNTTEENEKSKHTVRVPILEEPETSTYFHYGGTQIELSSLDEKNNSDSRRNFLKSTSTDNIARIIHASSKENVNKEGIIQEDVKEMPGTNVDKTDWANMFWTRFFGPSHLVTSFFTSFILHLLTFLLGGLVRPLLWDSVQVASAHFFQPFLVVLLNSILRPIFSFLQSIAESLSDICLPVAQSFGHVIRESSYICRACRLVEINTGNSQSGVQNV